MEKIAGLDFSNANNACLSLRTLAEWVRTGEVKLIEISPVLLETSKAGTAVDRAVGFYEGNRR